ncbi:MAG TPA: amidohydrolase [Dehalococcoidia bacterium]|nr:amidohydrolase [Dehalococcoidia bacterium]
MSPLKIDIFCHILPEKYKKALDEAAPGHVQQSTNNLLPTLWDLDHRFRIMDKYGVMQVLTLSRPPIEEVISDPKKAMDLTKRANDEMAEIVLKHRDRFPTAVAAVALTDVDASLKELERAIIDLRFRGVQIYTNMNGKPLDSPEFEPLFDMMARYNLPIWIHPTHGVTASDYSTETGGSRHAIANTFGWPYETTMAMNRLVFGGILERYPNLKVITHHCGGMVPFYEQRIIAFHDIGEVEFGDRDRDVLTDPPIKYYKKIYADTAIYGNTPGLMLGRAFFGIDHLLFGTDFPFAGQFGERVTRQTIDAIEAMDISDVEKKKIFEDNARDIMRLPI